LKTQNLKILIILLLFFVSCGTKQSVLANNNIVEKTPKLIFLNYNIRKTANNNLTISLINKIITEGKLKNTNFNTNENVKSGDLKCNQIDENNNILKTEIIKNPLVKMFEYVDDSNEFQLKKVELDSAQISLKLKLEPNTKYIIILSSIENLKELKPLIKTLID
jgi:hypothetical protein